MDDEVVLVFLICNNGKVVEGYFDEEVALRRLSELQVHHTLNPRNVPDYWMGISPYDYIPNWQMQTIEIPTYTT